MMVSSLTRTDGKKTCPARHSSTRSASRPSSPEYHASERSTSATLSTRWSKARTRSILGCYAAAGRRCSTAGRSTARWWRRSPPDLLCRPRGGVAEWLRHGPAKPVTAVRFRSPPPRRSCWSRAVHRALARSARRRSIPRPSRALLDRDDLGDGGGHGRRRRDLIAVLPHDLEVVDDRLTHQRFHLGEAAAGGDTPRQLWRVGGERVALSYDDAVAGH